MVPVICPFCLKYHDFSSSLACPESLYEEPAIVAEVYVRDYVKVPPLWLVTVGFRGHGKTTYLAALTLTLQSMSRVWKGMYSRPLAQYTIDKISEIRREALLGEVPPPNPRGVPRPLLLAVYLLPESKSRCLAMYDVAGELYESLDDVKQFLAPIKQVSTIWFLVSIHDLETDGKGRTVTDLFNAYLSGMESLKVDLRGRDLIVVYTKADKLVFTPEIKDYLLNDPYQALMLAQKNALAQEKFSLSDYIQTMRAISDQLENYTRDWVKDGAALINMVKAHGMNLSFCATSALGQEVNPSGRLSEAATRNRVLDPLLWAMAVEEDRRARKIAFVVSRSLVGSASEGREWTLHVWGGLSNYGEVSTYCLGLYSPVADPGQVPSVLGELARSPCLVGPIIEQLNPDSYILLVTDGPIIDLADFRDSSWKDRMLLVTTDARLRHEWPNRVSSTDGLSAAVLVDAVLRLDEGSERA